MLWISTAFAWLLVHLVSDAMSCPCESNRTRAVLAEFYRSTHGPYWTSAPVDNWMSEDMSVCSWHGFLCAADGSVSLYFFNNNLSGAFPAELSLLHDVRKITVSQNPLLSGTLPQEFSVWGASLRSFLVLQNNISGTLPPEYANWTQLEFFCVLSNHLSGTLSAGYSAWLRIQQVNLWNNSLTGTLPMEYAAWNVTRFLIGFNQFSGPIPGSYSNWRHLAEASLERNNFSGTLPSLTARFIVLDNNPHLHGELSSWTSAAVFASVCNTALCGSLPATWAGTVFVCQPLGDVLGHYSSEITADDFFALFAAGRLIAVVPRLHDCPPLTPPESTHASNGTTRASGSNAHSVVSNPLPLVSQKNAAGFASAAAVVLGAAYATSLAALHVSLQVTGPLARRLALCESVLDANINASDEANDVDYSLLVSEEKSTVQLEPIGSDFSSNPLSLRVPAHDEGRESVTAGAVVGNIAVAIGALFLGAVVSLLRNYCRRLRNVKPIRFAASAFVFVWSVVQEPTIAATSALVVLCTSSGAPPTLAIVVSCCGVLGVSLPLAGLLWWYVHARPCTGVPVHERGSTFQASRTSVAARGALVPYRYNKKTGTTAWAKISLFFRRVTSARSRWRVPFNYSQKNRRWSCLAHAEAINSAVGRLLLCDCRVPYSWIVLVDAITILLQGLLAGLAAEMSCRHLLTCCWALVAVCVTSAVFEVIMRPRSTEADCWNQILMSSSTAVVVLLTTVRISEETTDTFALCQCIGQLVLSLPLWCARCWRCWRWWSSTSKDKFRLRRRKPARHSPRTNPVLCSGSAGTHPLENLIQLICDSLPSGQVRFDQ